LSSRELKSMNLEHQTANPRENVTSDDLKPPAFRVPSAANAIAGVLISKWAYGHVNLRPRDSAGLSVKGKF